MKGKLPLVIALAIALPLLLVQMILHLGWHSLFAPAVKVGKSVSTPYGTYSSLTPGELKPILDSEDVFLVDTHIPPEGRLPKTDARIPYNEIEQQIDRFPADKSAKIVLACRSGRMSSEASQTLVRLGYSNVYNLEGGMVAWQAAGYEIVPESDR